MRWYGRLRREAEFASVRRTGQRASTATVSAYAVRGSHPTRIGVTTSKALGKAVVRNLVRRRIRGALDRLGPLASGQFRVVLVARPAAAQASYADLADDVASALSRVGR